MRKEKSVKRIMSLLLALAILLTVIPVGSGGGVLAASADYKTVSAGGNDIYMYGVSSAQDARIENGKYVIAYTGGEENGSGLYVDGAEVTVSVDTPEIEYGSYEISLDKAWTDSQTEWIAVKCSQASAIPSTRPLPDIDGITVTPYSGGYDEEEHDAVTVEGTQPGDAVSYSADGIDYDAAVPTIKDIGSQDIYVKVMRDGHNDYISGRLTASVNLGTIDWITVVPFDQPYDPSNAGEKPTVTITGELDAKPVTIQYSEDNGANYGNVVPKIDLPGTKTVKVKVSRNGYNDYEETVTAQMANASIEGIQVTPNPGVVYDGQEHPVVLNDGISGLQQGDEVFYSTDGISYSLDVPKYIDPGDYDFYIKVTRQYHDDYISFPDKFTFTIAKQPITGVTATGYTGTYNKSDLTSTYDAVISVDGADPTDVITYSRERDNNYGPDIPQVRRKADSGTYYVKVHRSDDYEDLIIPVTVTIEKAPQKLAFDKVNAPIYKEEGSNTFTVQAKNDAEAGHDSKIRYSVVSGNASVDPVTGVVTYTSAGTIQIKAETQEEADSDYSDSTQTCSVTVGYVKTPGYTVSPEQYRAGGYRWYSCKNDTDGFVITAPNGWTVIKGSNAQGQTGWADKITETNEGVYADYKIAFKNTATNEITDLITLPAFIIDKTDPQVSSFEFEAENTGKLKKAVNAITLGTFCKERVRITVNGTDFEDRDTSSGIASIKLYYYGVDGVTEVGEVKADSIDLKNRKAFFYIEPDYEGTIKAEVTDHVGRTSGKVLAHQKNANIGSDESGYMMVEDDAPVVSAAIKDEPLNENIRREIVNSRIIYSGDAKFSFSAQDTGSGLYSVDVKINGISYEKGGDRYPKNFSTSQDRRKHDFVISTEDLDEKYLKEDGSFAVNVTVIDNAGNYVERTLTIYKDTTAATIKGYKFSMDQFAEVPKTEGVYKAVEITDYGFYFKEEVVVTIAAEDIKAENETASGVKSITYAAVDIDGNSYEGKDVPVNGRNEISFTINKDFRGQIYAYATDRAGNCPDNSRLPSDYDSTAIITEGAYKGYVHPEGAIIETAAKHRTDSSIEFALVPEAQGEQNNTSYYSYGGGAQEDRVMDFDTGRNVPLYNQDISFDVKVTDTYSGIREVSYTIFEGTEETRRTVALNNEGRIEGATEGWSVTKHYGNLATEMTNTIAISGSYNNMVLLIELTDRAGNQSYDYYVFGIDKTAPSITVSYDNNVSDTQSGTGDYFAGNRTATILVQERNFNTENVAFTLLNEEGEAPEIIDEGLVTGGDGNGDGNVYRYVISYTADGVYTFDVAYTDRAGNTASVDYGDSVAPNAFILDKTSPTISVSYDNNDAQNGKFFKENRTATITVIEHNFDVNRVTVTQTSSISGGAVANPAISWQSSGDTHTGTIGYNTDGDYTFDITMTDRAGNAETGVDYGGSAAAQDFTIDTTYTDLVQVDGIENEGVLGLVNGDIDDEATITITINDVNLDSYNINLTRSRVLVTGESDEAENASQENVIDQPEVQCAEADTDVTAEFVTNASGTANATATVSIPKKNEEGVKNDGLYTLTVEARDMAGNTYDTDANILMFSVNRFGSVFTFSKDLYDLIHENDGYTQGVTSTDLTVYEYNATAVGSESVEVIANNDSKILAKSADYTASEDTAQTDTSWNKYTYTVKPDNFEDDGVYTLRISSKDAASITSQTVDYDVCSATFSVDSTPADIISVNYSTEVSKMAFSDAGSAKTEALTVDFAVEDLIRLEKVEVYVNDELEQTYLHGKDFDDANTFDGGQFVINDGGAAEQSFRIVAEDKAGNVVDTADKDSYDPGYVFFDRIVVTANALARFYANKLLFWGSIGGIAILTAGVWVSVTMRYRRKGLPE